MMNYVGSITVLDRGDAPAQAVIDRNARSLAQRVADETRTELSKVMSRVDNIYGHYEMRDQFSDAASNASNMEYVGDLKELEELITDQVKKKKYQKQVTIFIVGFENVSGQKLRLLQQVNEFFMANANVIEEDDDNSSMSPDLDMEEVQERIEDSLKTAEELTHRLADINQEMIDYLVTYANQKASNKGKKKLEKALAQAKQDIENLGEKLLQAGQEIEEKDEKVQQLFKQIEMKNMECQRYKTAAEIAKKSAVEAENLRLEIGNRDNKIRDLEKLISDLQLDVGMKDNLREKSQQRMASSISEHTSRLQDLQDQVDRHQMELMVAKREENPDEKEHQRSHEEQMTELKEEHHKHIEELKRQHADEIRKLLIERYAGESDTENAHLSNMDDGSRQSSRQETSRASTKPANKKASSTKNTPAAPPKSYNSRQSSKAEVNRQKSKELSDASVQDEGGNADTAHADSKPSTRGKGKSTLETVVEGTDVQFADAYDLKDEASWAAVPVSQMASRFIQYRKLTKEKLTQLEDELQTTVTKTNRKVQTLKAQFQEHKSKWEAERKLLVDQVDQTQKLQTEAEKEADAAMLQLEDFIIEQEELEKEEEKKLKEIEGTPRSQQSQRATPSSEDDQLAQKLLQQTDDAKAEAHRQGTFIEPSDQVDCPPIVGNTPEEIRISSARSRASIRSHHKTVLEMQRAMTEERRVKSPMVNVHAQISVLTEAELNENGDMPFPDDVKTGEKAVAMAMHDIGTSPPEKELSNLSRKSIPMVEHPIVLEYMKTYDGVIMFKKALSKLLLDKEMMSLSQVLADIEPYHFDKDDLVQPQVEMMTTNVYHILEEVTSLMGSILYNDRDYPVSSLFNGSRDPTRPTLYSADSGIRGKSHPTPRSATSRDSETLQNLMELQHQYNTLQRRLKEETKKHEDALNHNTVVMMEMQDTINSLQRELSNLGQKSRHSEYVRDDTPESTIMFTRLDSERNAKIMKRAVNEGRMASEKFENVVRTMDDYVSLPAQRLAQLVTKYVHHCQMKEIEVNVRKSQSLNENVFQILDRMEMLQNMRAKRWADKMDDVGAERLRLAGLLMQTLDKIERESGIFLIKPMFAYKGKNDKLKYTGKISKNYKVSGRDSLSLRSGSAVAPAPTPSANARHTQDSTLPVHVPPSEGDPSRPTTYGQSGLTGNMAQLLGDYPRPVWNANASLPHAQSDEGHPHHLQSSHINTPRILELDINRMLIGQNQVSMMVHPHTSTEDRLINAANSSTRSYVTVSRPAVHMNSGMHKERPNSHTGMASQNSAPPTTPQHSQTPHSATSGRNSREVMSPVDDHVFTRTIPATPPLPPITPSPRDVPANSNDSQDPPLPPRSPPGSSLRQTPYSRD